MPTETSGPGIIPANTGKMQVRQCTARRIWDHPREYGENRLSRGSVVNGLGSSPRIRGKSFAAYSNASHAGDHPREYGENCRYRGGAYPARGSSPRIRGKFQSWQTFNESTRIIPANTGKMRYCFFEGSYTWDHPREYGENSLRQAANEGIQGSSPRIRGKWCNSIASPLPLGIIPANTGKIRTPTGGV